LSDRRPADRQAYHVSFDFLPALMREAFALIFRNVQKLGLVQAFM